MMPTFNWSCQPFKFVHSAAVEVLSRPVWQYEEAHKEAYGTPYGNCTQAISC